MSKEMQLSPSSFLSTRLLPTVLLEGAKESNGRMVFSPDARWLLAWGDSGHLQVWDVHNRQRTLFYNENTVRGVLVAEQLGGVLVVAGDSLLLFRATTDGFVHHTLATHLPGLSESFFPDSEDAAVLVCVSDREVVCCNRKYIVTLDSATYQPISFSTLLTDTDRRLEHLSVCRHNGAVLICTISSVREHGFTSYRYTITSSAGTQVSEVSVDIPGYRLMSAPDSRRRPGILTCSGERSVVVSQSDSGVIKAFSLSPYEEGMSYTASESGTIISGRTSTSLLFWAGKELIGRHGVEERPFDLKLTDDGQFVVILFCDDVKAPDVTGIFNPSTGRQLGYCTGHVVGLTPVAFSKSNHYFATLVTDGTAGYHPARLPSGTVVLSELPTGDRV